MQFFKLVGALAAGRGARSWERRTEQEADGG